MTSTVLGNSEILESLTPSVNAPLTALILWLQKGLVVGKNAQSKTYPFQNLACAMCVQRVTIFCAHRLSENESGKTQLSNFKIAILFPFQKICSHLWRLISYVRSTIKMLQQLVLLICWVFSPVCLQTRFIVLVVLIYTWCQIGLCVDVQKKCYGQWNCCTWQLKFSFP
jgi:hypothetical protein